MISLQFWLKMIVVSCKIYYQLNLILVSVRHQPHLLVLGHICLACMWIVVMLFPQASKIEKKRNEKKRKKKRNEKKKEKEKKRKEKTCVSETRIVSKAIIASTVPKLFKYCGFATKYVRYCFMVYPHLVYV